MDKKTKAMMKKLWWFIWEDDSICSWVVNIILAFVLIKFIVYPVLGLLLATSHPIVAVVSGSMEHKLVNPCIQMDQRGFCLEHGDEYEICGKLFTEKEKVDLDFFWDTCGAWYTENGISKDQFNEMSFRNGFNTGDIMILYGTDSKDLKLGDIVVFQSSRPDPIIHRIVNKQLDEEGKYYFQTKGDHNAESYSFESSISEDYYIGRAVIRVPLLGYVKIMAVKLLSFIGG